MKTNQKLLIGYASFVLLILIYIPFTIKADFAPKPTNSKPIKHNKVYKTDLLPEFNHLVVSYEQCGKIDDSGTNDNLIRCSYPKGLSLDDIKYYLKNDTLIIPEQEKIKGVSMSISCKEIKSITLNVSHMRILKEQETLRINTTSGKTTIENKILKHLFLNARNNEISLTNPVYLHSANISLTNTKANLYYINTTDLDARLRSNSELRIDNAENLSIDKDTTSIFKMIQYDKQKD